VAGLGAEVKVVTPYYLNVGQQAASKKIPVGGEEHLGILRRPLAAPETGSKTGASAEVYLVDNDEYFGRPSLYGFADDAERFIFFSRAALVLTKELGWKPDVIHCHDWQTGLVPVLLREELSSDPFFEGCATVFTIHNLAYQGLFDAGTVRLAGLDESLFTFDKLEFYGQFSFIKGGIVFSDLVTTVSPQYAKEIQTEEFGEGLDGALKERKESLVGVLNGIDYRTWDPSTDSHLQRCYDSTQVAARKRLNRSALRKEAGLPPAKGPLIGMVSRLSAQKGWDILAEAAEEMLKMDVQLVALGTGDKTYEEMVVKLQKKFPKKVAAFIRFDERLAHRIYAGSDLFLMPSRYEPCGLGQMIALRYGSVPVVRATGGLADTISDFNADPSGGNGFVFEEYSAKGLLDGVRRGVEAFGKADVWESLVKRGMACDFSWERSAGEYLKIYQAAIAAKSGKE
jgi:starch synthase